MTRLEPRKSLICGLFVVCCAAGIARATPVGPKDLQMDLSGVKLSGFRQDPLYGSLGAVAKPAQDTMVPGQ